jgi:hypothetical protein
MAAEVRLGMARPRDRPAGAVHLLPASPRRTVGLVCPVWSHRGTETGTPRSMSSCQALLSSIFSPWGLALPKSPVRKRRGAYCFLTNSIDSRSVSHLHCCALVVCHVAVRCVKSRVVGGRNRSSANLSQTLIVNMWLAETKPPTPLGSWQEPVSSSSLASRPRPSHRSQECRLQLLIRRLRVGETRSYEPGKVSIVLVLPKARCCAWYHRPSSRIFAIGDYWIAVLQNSEPTSGWFHVASTCLSP